MSKVGRNEPCPCGSGKKFKRCCFEQVQTEERIERQRVEDERLSSERERLAAEKELLEARETETRRRLAECEEVDRLSQDVLVLIDAGQLDQAEAAAHRLEGRLPNDTVGVERLGQVCEARGKTAEAADHYRRAVGMMDGWGEGHYCDCCRARPVKAVRRLDPDGPPLVLGRDPQ